MSQRVEQLKDEGTRAQVVISGAVAGLVARFCVAPLDVIKIRLQLQIHSLSDPLSNRHGLSGLTSKGTLGTLKQILRDEGIRAFWKGNIPAEGLYLSYTAVQFVAYRSANLLLTHEQLPVHLPSAANSFLSGALAGTVATTSTYPLDLLRTRFAAQGVNRVYPGLLRGVRQIRQNEGWPGFFRGLSAANAQIVPYMGLFFTLYEALKPALHGADAALPLSQLGSADGAAAVLASVLAKSAVYPLDTVRKRLQVQGPSRAQYVHGNIPEYQGGVAATARLILNREGVRGMYRGLPVALLKAAPTSAATLWTFERVMEVMKKYGWLEGRQIEVD